MRKVAGPTEERLELDDILAFLLKFDMCFGFHCSLDALDLSRRRLEKVEMLPSRESNIAGRLGAARARELEPLAPEGRGSHRKARSQDPNHHPNDPTCSQISIPFPPGQLLSICQKRSKTLCLHTKPSKALPLMLTASCIPRSERRLPESLSNHSSCPFDLVEHGRFPRVTYAG